MSPLFPELLVVRLAPAEIAVGANRHPCDPAYGTEPWHGAAEALKSIEVPLSRVDVEESGVDFPSALEGRMHACGHDGHTAIMLGVAHTLAQIAEELPGRYLFVFQPAEEIVSGARLMIANGLLEQHHADFAIGLHLAAWAESGAVITKPGLLWGGSDAFEITFKGPGGHGGMMGRAGNVINAQAFLVERLMTIVEGLEWEDGTPCHTTIGDVRTDGAWNIVPRHALVKGSLRTFNAALRTQALQRLEDLLLETRTEFSVESELRLVHGTIPILNHPTPTEIVLETARELIGTYPALEEVVWAQEEPQNMGAWRTIRHRLEEAAAGIPVRFVGRPWRASTAEGYPTAHVLQQDRIARAVLTR